VQDTVYVYKVPCILQSALVQGIVHGVLDSVPVVHGAVHFNYDNDVFGLKSMLRLQKCPKSRSVRLRRQPRCGMKSPKNLLLQK